MVSQTESTAGTWQLYQKMLPIADSSDLDRAGTTADLITNQASDAYCNQTSSLVGKPGSCYFYDCNDILVWQSKVESAVQKIEFASIRARTFCLIILS